MKDVSPKTGLVHKEARTEEQRALMKKIEEDGVCPFCAEHFKKYHPCPILKETDYWFVTTNMSPYKGTKYHFLLVYKPAHISHLNEIPSQAYADLLLCLQWLSTEYDITGGSFFMRFGDTRFNGSSVAHLHAQMIVGDIDALDHEPVRVKLG